MIKTSRNVEMHQISDHASQSDTDSIIYLPYDSERHGVQGQQVPCNALSNTSSASIRIVQRPKSEFHYTLPLLSPTFLVDCATCHRSKVLRHKIQRSILAVIYKFLFQIKSRQGGYQFIFMVNPLSAICQTYACNPSDGCHKFVYLTNVRTP